MFCRPSYISEKAWERRLETTPWLFCESGSSGCIVCRDTPFTAVMKSKGLKKSVEWANGKIEPAGTNDKNKAGSIRTKIKCHEESEAHCILSQIVQQRKSEQLPCMFGKGLEKHLVSTERVFRTAYHLAKEERPFTDHPKLMDLQIANGLDMGILLQSRKTGAEICEFIGKEMQKKIVIQILDEDQPIAIMVDESTTSSQSSTLVICVRATVHGSQMSFFLDLIEVETTSSENIVKVILKKLKDLGMDEQWLSTHLICFASDGASNMLGKHSGVGNRLKAKFPNLILWHCANHRLELAVGEAIKDADGINNFRVFMDKLFTLYHASPKNKYELKACATELEEQLYAIGRVLDTRWVSSSARTVEAVLKNLPSLVAHFTIAKDDTSRKSADRSMYKGLLNHITTPAFIGNLCLMADALQPLAELSRALQHRDIDVVTAHKLIQSKVGLFRQRKDAPGDWYRKYLSSADSEEFICSIDATMNLTGTAAVQAISPRQFYQSLFDMMNARLLTTQSRRGEKLEDVEKHAKVYEELLNNIQIINPVTWPATLPPDFGRAAMKSLAHWFFLSEKENSLLEQWEIYKASMGSHLDTAGVLKQVFTATKTIIVSTAECERSFSVMNDTATLIRNRLSVDRIGMLILIKLLGPDVKDFYPTPFVKRWLQSGRRSANTTASRKREMDKKDGDRYYEPLHKLFKA